MLGFRSYVVYCLILGVIFPNTLTEDNNNRQCDLSKLENGCPAGERCMVTANGMTCQCLQGYVFAKTNNGIECVHKATTPSPDSSTTKPETKPQSKGSSIGLILFLGSVFVISGVLIYFGARRYKLLQRIRQYRQNRYGNVLVTRDDDDDDDPPIA